MSNDKIVNPEEEIFVEKPKRNHNAKKNGKGGGDNWTGKASKQYKHRLAELEEDSLEEDLDNWR